MKTLTLILVLLFSYNFTNAQLGRALLKKATKSKKDLELDWTVFDNTPAVTFYSLLEGTAIDNSGYVDLNYYTGTFISYLQANGKEFDAIYDKEKFMKIKLYKGDEHIKTTIMTLGQGNLGDKRLQMVNPSSGHERMRLSEHGVGTYRVQFYAGTKMYYTFEFDTYKVTNNDPYAKLKEMYLARGPWDDYIYLKNNSSGNIEVGVYLRHEEFKPKPAKPGDTSKDIYWSLGLFKNDQLVGTSFKKDVDKDDIKNHKKAHTSRGKWDDFRSAIRLIDKKNGDNNKTEYAPFTGLDDGSYRLELKVEGEELPRKYFFTVTSGNIVLPTYQDRNKNTDPTKLIEGWNNYVWLKAEK